MHTWKVKVMDGLGQTTEETVVARWRPDHVLTEESVMGQGEFQVKKRGRFKNTAKAVSGSVVKVDDAA